MPSICEQLQTAYQTLKAKKQGFDLSYEEAKTTGDANDARQARKLMQELIEIYNLKSGGYCSLFFTGIYFNTDI